LARSKSQYSRQRRLEQELKQGLDDLRQTREILRDAEQRAMEGHYFRGRPFARITDADYKRMLKLEQTLGVYEPKSRDLSVSRKRAIRQHWIQLEHLMKDAVFAQYPSGASAKTKRQIKANLRKSYPKAPAASAYFSGQAVAPKGKQMATKKGIWLPKSPRQITAPIGTLMYDKDTGLYAVKVRKKTKSGLYAQELRYIAGSEVLELKQKKLQKRFEKIGPLKRNQRLRFLIGKNESRRTFRNMDELFRYAARYRRDDQARATFLNELIIEVVSKGPNVYKHRGQGKRRRLVKDPWTVRERAFRASNYHELSPDIVDDMMADLEEEYEE
jgi:hypothetical protein